MLVKGDPWGNSVTQVTISTFWWWVILITQASVGRMELRMGKMTIIFLKLYVIVFLTQHVSTPTRGRGAQIPSVLDLVLTSVDDTIEFIDVGPLWAQVTMLQLCLDISVYQQNLPTRWLTCIIRLITTRWGSICRWIGKKLLEIAPMT